MEEGAWADEAARRFHEAYERLAPDFGYETRRGSAVPWDEVPEQNRALMRAVMLELFRETCGFCGVDRRHHHEAGIVHEHGNGAFFPLIYMAGFNDPCDTCGGSQMCVHPSIDAQGLVVVPCPDCAPADV